MLKKSGLSLAVCLLLIFILSGWASGQCVPDGNDSAATAKPIGFTDTVADWVCPDDKFDYYSMVIPGGADASGTITFESPQVGTVIRFAGSAGPIAENATSNTTHQYDIPIAAGSLTPGTYYLRVTFYSAYAYDHQYTLTLDITVKQGPKIVALRPSMISKQPSLIAMLRPPWPSRRCNAANRARSGLNGPAGSALPRVQYNIKDGLNISLWPSVTCSDLLVGPSNRAYLVNQDLSLLVAYDLSTGYLWKHPISVYTNPFMLDESGNIYFLTGAGFNVGEKASVNCLNSKGELQWSVPMPGDNNAISRLRSVGARIYVSTKRSGEGYYAFAFERDGRLAWSAGPLNDELINLAEDPEGYLYFETWQGLYQYDLDGNYKWYYEFPKPEGTGFFTGAGLSRGPVIGHDGRVWVNNTQKPQFLVINRDGSNYKQIDYAPGSLALPYMATFVCIGGDSRLYMADNLNVVICYSDWSDEVWRISIPCAGGKILDMIMDTENRIYILYFIKKGENNFDFHWASIDTNNGSIIYDASIPLPQGYNKYELSNLVIGGGRNLIYLCPSGILTVLDPTVVTDEPGHSMVPAG